MIDRSFLKERGFGAVVLLQFGDRGDMAEVFLGDVVIIEVKILLQGGFQMPGRGEGGRFQHLGDAAVEALDHAVGLRVPGLDQAMLDAAGGAGLIEGVPAGRLALAGGAEAVGNSFPLSVSTVRTTNGALACKRSRNPAAVAAVLSGRIS